MIPKSCSVHYRLKNDKYPLLIVRWERDEDEMGAKGIAMIFKTPNEKEERTYTISIRQTLPLGLICFELDGCIGGAWQFGTIDGAGLTERDLQWATAWGALAIKDKKMRFYNE